MRRQFLGALLFAGTLAFTACQNETIIYVDENGNPIENVELKEGEGLLKINLSNTSADSRAVRPVGSSAAANNVNVVKIYVFKGANTAFVGGQDQPVRELFHAAARDIARAYFAPKARFVYFHNKVRRAQRSGA